ncbi:hypothetical protein FE236_10590 [Mariprofundus erugo]|uniref:7TM diverse intracellular signaling domain-containing protein n=1 Tax=Mariprofundus erugo TaxID=2528639 RepID=UPI0010FEBD7B|nr:7TM diverse intracellular signaling domain-containing protein [Mariprofundus erugo]TLS74951.1 hypothetical protein FE236_10590 [Mariprofundus erugo]
MISLGGVWRAYFGRILMPDQLADAKVADTYTPVDISRMGAVDHPGTIQEPPQQADAWSTYTLTVLLPAKPQPLAIRLSPYLSYAQLYANGRLVVVIGKAQAKKRFWERRLVNLGEVSGKLELVLQASNFDAYRSALAWNMSLGDPVLISREELLAKTHDTLIILTLLLIGIVYLILYARHRHRKTLLYAALFAIFVGINTMFSLEGVVYDLLPGLTLEFGYLLNFISLIWATVFLIYLVKDLFKEDVWPLVGRFYLVISTILTALIFALGQEQIVDLELVHRLLVQVPISVYGIYLVIVAALRCRSRCLPTMAGIVIMALTVIYDVISFEGWLPVYDMTYYGIVAFLLLLGMARLGLFARSMHDEPEQPAAAAQANVESLQQADVQPLSLPDEPQPDQIALPADERELVVCLMWLCLEIWQRVTGTGKVELAEQSGLWRAQLDGDTWRTRTLDRYLKVETLPNRPRWQVVMKTAEYVLTHTDEHPELREQLQTTITALRGHHMQRAMSA